MTDGIAYLTPEAKARVNIDRQLLEAGWVVQDLRSMYLYAGPGVAVREFAMKSGHGETDYLLFVPIDGRPVSVGVIEAKKEGSTLAGVETQSRKYTDGLPGNLSTPIRPLPIAYESTGSETMFTTGLDPDPRARQVFAPPPSSVAALPSSPSPVPALRLGGTRPNFLGPPVPLRLDRAMPAVPRFRFRTELLVVPPLLGEGPSHVCLTHGPAVPS